MPITQNSNTTPILDWVATWQEMINVLNSNLGTFRTGTHTANTGNFRISVQLGGQTIANTATIWTSATDGANSGLDADKLDGLHATGFYRIGTAANTLSLRHSFVFGGQTIANTATIWTSGNDGSTSGLDADLLDGLHATGFYRIGTAANTINLRQSLVFGGQTIANTATIWTSVTDGANSGLDADKLDGLHASAFLRIDTAPLTLNLRDSFTFGGQSIANTETIWTTGNLSARINALTANTAPNANNYYTFGYDEVLQVTRKFRINNHAHPISQVTNLQTTLDAKAAKTQVFAMPGFISVGVSGDTRIVINIPFAGTITKVTTRCTSGTATMTVKVNTTALGGSTNSISSSEQTQAHASSNTFVVGDDIVITLSSVSSVVNITYMIEGTITLS
jgi:hypothetical protein